MLIFFFAFLLGIVGTIEEKQSYEYIEQEINQYKSEAEGITNTPKFDIWVQQATSAHRFDIMDKSKLKEVQIREENKTVKLIHDHY